MMLDTLRRHALQQIRRGIPEGVDEKTTTFYVMFPNRWGEPETDEPHQPYTADERPNWGNCATQTWDRFRDRLVPGMSFHVRISDRYDPRKEIGRAVVRLPEEKPLPPGKLARIGEKQIRAAQNLPEDWQRGAYSAGSRAQTVSLFRGLERLRIVEIDVSEVDSQSDPDDYPRDWKIRRGEMWESYAHKWALLACSGIRSGWDEDHRKARTDVEHDLRRLDRLIVEEARQVAHGRNDLEPMNRLSLRREMFDDIRRPDPEQDTASVFVRFANNQTIQVASPRGAIGPAVDLARSAYTRIYGEPAPRVVFPVVPSRVGKPLVWTWNTSMSRSDPTARLTSAIVHRYREIMGGR